MRICFYRNRFPVFFFGLILFTFTVFSVTFAVFRFPVTVRKPDLSHILDPQNNPVTHNMHLHILTPKNDLKWPINLLCMFLGGGARRST